MDWTAGYVADVGYTFGYCSELNPLRLKLAFLNAGVVPPETGVACELGFGQGLSVNIHAAASVTQWSGTDFNPSQAGFAQELASASGADARLFDDAFEDYCSREDLPDFDYIGLHGIWSWISDRNREVIVDFVRRKLKVGGVLYAGYNTQPGWAAFAPMRHLLNEHAHVFGAAGQGTISRIDGALEFAGKLLATDPIYARINTAVGQRVQQMTEQNRQYLAHEYFNRDWHPMHFATMAEWLAPAKVSYACSAHYIDHVNELNLTAPQQVFLQEIADPMFRESTRDFMVNMQFRRDYWVKGLRRLSSWERLDALRALNVMLTVVRSEVSLKVSGSMGEAQMNEAVYAPILDLLADYQAHSVAQLEQMLRSKGVSFNQLVEALVVLTGGGQLAAVQDEAVIARAKPCTDRLNAHLIRKARGSGELKYLASPVTGGGVVVTRFAQLFLLALSQGKKQPAELAQFAWQLLAAQGQKLVKAGRTLESADDNLVELTEQAMVFVEKQLPLLTALQIA